MKGKIVGLLILLILPAIASADDVYWTDNSPANSLWGNAGNWDAMVWDPVNLVYNDVADHIPGSLANNDWALINKAVGSGPVVDISYNNVYGLQISNGSMVIQNGGYIGSKAKSSIGNAVGSTGVVTVQSGGVFTMNYNTSVGLKGNYVGEAGNGTLNCYGTLYASFIAHIGAADTGVGTINVHDGAVMNYSRAALGSFLLGEAGQGTINIDGGLMDIAGDLKLAVWNTGLNVNSRGHIEMSGGTIISQNILFDTNYATMNDPTPLVYGTVHQTDGEFIFDGADQTLALNRANQAIALGWWTTDPGLSLEVTQLNDGPAGELRTHVNVVPEPAALALFLGALPLLRRRRRA